jgi:hypothetical protein
MVGLERGQIEVLLDVARVDEFSERDAVIGQALKPQ